MNKPDNSQEFADKMTAQILAQRAHDCGHVASMTGLTKLEAAQAIKDHGCKWVAVDAIRKAKAKGESK